MDPNENSKLSDGSFRFGDAAGQGAMRHAGWAMAGILVAMLAAYSINVGRPSPDRSMEKICMASSQETWMRQRSGETSAWKTPTINGGELRIQKPPLLIWLNIAAWSDIDPETAQVDELAFRARLVTI